VKLTINTKPYEFEHGHLRIEDEAAIREMENQAAEEALKASRTARLRACAAARKRREKLQGA
jgi:hypothetical protein